jgi:myo-inositol 2-dehydrogenase/D-chiro-inositol 1-dehydrogenase
MAVRVGVVGGGTMGAAHARLLAGSVAGAELAGVYDPDPARASGAFDDPRELIEAADAVLVASPDDTHERYVLTCLAAGRPVLCEKPLASTAEACRRLVEVDDGGLVQVGFMRRFDPGYLELKRVLDAAELGAPLLMHCVHRNASAPPGFGSEELLRNSATHEIDAARWLLGEEVTEVTVRTPRTAGLLDPQLLVLRMESGVLVDVEIFVNARYGYDVRCEIVGEAGTAALRPGGPVTERRDGTERVTLARDWRDRFAVAYRAELQSWVDGVVAGERRGPDAWDGYVASAVAEACVESLRSGEPRRVTGLSRPPSP